MSASTDSLTPAQQRAITARGNLLVTAGAGTGKTQTLIARCLRLIDEERCPVGNILMVTFTEAAAAEMRLRLRLALAARRRERPDDGFLAEQAALLDDAHIGTLHAFCLRLVRRHFYELVLDPRVSVLDEQQTAPLLHKTIEELLEARYGDTSEAGFAFRALAHQTGRDAALRALVLRLHRHAQSLADPTAWLDGQARFFSDPEPAQWRAWFVEAFEELRSNWLPQLKVVSTAAPAVGLCAAALEKLPVRPDATAVGEALRSITCVTDADSKLWPSGTKGKVRDGLLKAFFKDAAFLAELAPQPDGHDPLAEDWEWSRHPMLTLLRLTGEFTAAFSRAKRELGGVDFADLEQLTLRLLRQRPEIAHQWRAQFHHVFVDEYQDINHAQDAILRAISHDGEVRRDSVQPGSPAASSDSARRRLAPPGLGNRFLVGDVKQSIYRFRRGDPKIFADYSRRWSGVGAEGARESLADNFRSRAGLLAFLNPLFSSLMSERLGGVAYEPLRFGAPEQRGELADSTRPRVEFHLISRDSEEPDNGNGDGNYDGSEDLLAHEREARLVARRLKALHAEHHPVWDKDRREFRAATWRDMVVLLRSRASRVESFAREFHQAGVPLQAGRAGFFASLEISDLLNLLRLLDNPLQDVPLLAVLRSPLVALTLDELALIRAHNAERSWWLVLQRFRLAGAAADPLSAKAWRKADEFLRTFEQWRTLARQGALSDCLEAVLGETHYDGLLLAGERGPERAANVRRFLAMVRRFDPYQRQGLYRFLQFVEAQEKQERDLESAPPPAGDTVQLMTIHQSKGLEFPIVALAGLGARFNERDLNEAILLTESFGLGPKVTPPGAENGYPSLAHWLGKRAERRELLGEELRLFYVALTRARDTLVLAGTAARQSAGRRWAPQPFGPLAESAITGARSHLDWLLQWLPQITASEDWQDDRAGENALLRWRLYAENDPAFAATASTNGPGAEVTELAERPDDPAAVSAVLERLSWQYPHATATTLPAKTSVSALRRRRAEEPEEESVATFVTAGRRFQFRDEARPRKKLSAAETGTAHHLFLQALALDQAGDIAALRLEAQRVHESGWLDAEQMAAIDFEALAAFWQGDVGRAIRACPPKCVQREMPFTARFTPAELAAAGLPGLTDASPDEFLVVQGVADLAVIQPEEIWLLDFKTDHFAPEELEAKRAHHGVQLRLYALALARIYRRPVTKRWLHFLAASITSEV